MGEVFLASSQLQCNSKTRGGMDGAMVALHNQSETIEEESKWFCLS